MKSGYTRQGVRNLDVIGRKRVAKRWQLHDLPPDRYDARRDPQHPDNCDHGVIVALDVNHGICVNCGKIDPC